MLSDIRVIDLAGEAGLFASRLLAQLGADVIRVEPPSGSDVRRRAPFFENVEGVERSLYHLHFNAGKRGVTLDLHSEQGRGLLLRLIAEADVLIETASPGEMDALGLGYESLRAVNPQLLYGTITPFGQDGPMAHYRANDIVAGAMSGIMYLNGDPDDPPNQPTAEQAYHMSSLALASGILMALVGRDRRAAGGGQRIDVSMQEATAMATLQNANPNTFAWFGDVPARRGFIGPAGGRSLYQCRDGLWVSFVVPPYRWNSFLNWLDEQGIESELRDEKYLDRAYRVQNPGAVTAATQQLIARHDREDVFHEGQRRQLLAMPVNDVQNLAENPQLAARGYFSETQHALLGHTVRDTGAPFVFNGERPTIARAAPALGEHNHDVYCGLLGLDESALTRLRRDGVV